VGASVIESSKLAGLLGGVIGATTTMELELKDEDGNTIQGHDKKLAKVLSRMKKHLLILNPKIWDWMKVGGEPSSLTSRVSHGA